MKNFLFAAAAIMSIAPSMADEVGALGGLGEPGHGQIDIRRLPKPQLVYAEPIVIQRSDVVEAGDPVYLHVPRDHAADWRKHCQQYNACDKRVYFVEDNWYNKVYVPEHRNKRSGSDGNAKKRGKD